MFLATTGLTEFWDCTDSPINLLGSWCLRADCQALWSKVRYTVLPTPWDDRQRFYDAAQYLDKCQEALLARLTDYLNGVHGTSFSTRYWRIIIGPWLILYTHAVYDRFVCLRNALDAVEDTQTIVMDSESFRCPSDFMEMSSLVATDAYNLQLYSQLLAAMGRSFPAKKFQWTASGASNDKESISRKVAKSVLAGLETSTHKLFRGRWQVGLREVMPIADAWKLAWTTRFRFLPMEFSYDSSFQSSRAVFNRARQGLASIGHTDEFERILAALLPWNFPTLDMEGYRAALSRTSRSQECRIIVAGYGWYTDPPLAYLGSRLAEQRGRILTAQHGAAYGMMRSVPYEAHEKSIGDRFLVWGWGDEAPKCANVSDPRLSRLAKTRRETRKQPAQRKIVLVGTGQPRYLYRFHSAPVGNQWQEYYAWQTRFLAALKPTTRAWTHLRAYPIDYGHASQGDVLRQFPDVGSDDPKLTFPKSAQESTAVVIDHAGTSMLEALVIDVPTILYWDSERWEMRREAQTYFDALRSAEILWHSPEQAADKLDRIIDNPSTWWDSDSVRRARGEFIRRFAKTDSDWRSTWVGAIRPFCNTDEVLRRV